MHNFLNYILQDLNKLLQRKHLIRMFAYINDRGVYPDKPTSDDGIVFINKSKKLEECTYGYYIGDEFYKLKPNKNKSGAPFTIYDKIECKPGDMVNIKTTLETTVGRFITNYVLLVDPFGDIIPFINSEIKLGKLENNLAKLIMEDNITVAQYKKYINNGYSLLHMGELFVPTITEKSLTVDDNIIKRRDELLEEHKDELTDPKVVAAIERELVSMYKESLKGDPSERYFGASSKAYNVQAKKINLMVGGMDDFGGSGGKIITNKKALADGWDKDNFPAIANEIRKGSYSRGKEVQKGGEITKFIFRAFQDVTIDGDDCKTKEGLTITFDESVHPSSFLGVNVIDDKNTVITSKNVDSFVGKTVTIRSPMFCKSKKSICYKCAGEYFKKLGIKNPGPLAIDISSTMMLKEMKAMHGEALVLKDLEHENYFVD